MRDVFGTRLRRSEDAFPPVIGVAAHKGGVYKTSVSVHLAQDLALKGLRVLLVEGNDPQGTASMYHGWVPISIFMLKTRYSPSILAKKMMPAMR
jgi:chromosome partitioning protein